MSGQVSKKLAYKNDIKQLKGNVSINQFIVNAIAEKIATLKTVDYLEQWVQNGSKEHALSILSRASLDAPVNDDL